MGVYLLIMNHEGTIIHCYSVYHWSNSSSLTGETGPRVLQLILVMIGFSGAFSL